MVLAPLGDSNELPTPIDNKEYFLWSWSNSERYGSRDSDNWDGSSIPTNLQVSSSKDRIRCFSERHNSRIDSTGFFDKDRNIHVLKEKETNQLPKNCNALFYKFTLDIPLLGDEGRVVRADYLHPSS